MTGAETTRIAFTVQYDGEAFYGWQLQPRHESVQGALEAVLSKLFDRPCRVVGSGRTDRGVHSVGQVAAADAPPRWSAAELRRAMNALLPSTVWIAHAAEVAPRFHPRYDATARSYVYRVGTAEHSASPFLARWCWSYARPLDLEPMNEAAGELLGDHSFRAFAKAGQEERGDRCIVTAAEWVDSEPAGVDFRITANRFLHHMVRYLVGTMVEIGAGRRPVGDIARLLRADAALETSPPAPPQGLYLARVEYPPNSYEPGDATVVLNTAGAPFHPERNARP